MKSDIKTVYMVFNDKEKITVAGNLYANLKYVFEEYIRVKTCFLDEIKGEDIADGDLFIVLYRDRVYAMRNYTLSLDKVVVLSRTVQKKYLADLIDIPEGTDVLVVNDSCESTLETANTLYELGLNHINLIPYEQGREGAERYKDIRIAVTPNETEMVPKSIPIVMNIGDRYIDLSTFVSIINRLNLNNERITRNLIRYTSMIAGTEIGINHKYLSDHLKSEMLKKVIHKASEVILLTDANYTTVYANDKAQTLFDLKEDRASVNLRVLFEDGARDLTEEGVVSNKLLHRKGTNYIVNKNDIRILDQLVGYSILLNDEQAIQNMSSDLNQQLVKTGLVAKYCFDHILCKSEIMKKCIALTKKAALTDFAVLIDGESGTGKELVAQSIHNYSKRKNNAFVAINCAALPEALLESELFGYEKGAFTGASPGGKAGLFERANRGTIFLDEIGDMSLNLQARLLRALQEKQIMRIGSDRLIDIDIRIIAATNKNLMEEVGRKAFRQDLYYRLCHIPVTLPPLRERSEDALYLLKHFLGKDYERLTKEDQGKLSRYRWPGNVRELRNAANYFKTLGELPPSIGGEKPDFAEQYPYVLTQEPSREDSQACPQWPSREAAQAYTLVSEKRRRASVLLDVPLNSEAAEHSRKGGASQRWAAADSVEVEIKTLVLQIVRAYTGENSGIGRTAILQQLQGQGIRISDDKARKFLAQLGQQGFIRIGRGRTGCRISPEGERFLDGK